MGKSVTGQLGTSNREVLGSIPDSSIKNGNRGSESRGIGGAIQDDNSILFYKDFLHTLQISTQLYFTLNPQPFASF